MVQDGDINRHEELCALSPRRGAKAETRRQRGDAEKALRGVTCTPQELRKRLGNSLSSVRGTEAAILTHGRRTAGPKAERLRMCGA